MSQKPPPVPPENRSAKGPGEEKRPPVDTHKPEAERDEQRGRHANIRQNTHNQGYQQDR